MSGGSGGDTTVTINSLEVLALAGGGGGSAWTTNGGGSGGRPRIFGSGVLQSNVHNMGGSVTPETVEAGAMSAARAVGALRTLGPGFTGATTNGGNPGSSSGMTGAASPYGADHWGTGPGNGYGYGARAVSSGAGRAGGPGFLMLIFEEGL